MSRVLRRYIRTRFTNRGRARRSKGQPPLLNKKSLNYTDQTAKLAILPKLAIGKPNDKYEQEADRVADKVVNSPDPTVQKVKDGDKEVRQKPLAETITPLVQKQEDVSSDLSAEAPAKEDAFSKEEEKQEKATHRTHEQEELLAESKSDQSTEYLWAIEEDITEIYIGNAGLALLWVYMVPFFKEMKLIKNDRFINKKAQQKAVHLLQYLVSGETQTPEYELSFNKLLCGMDIAEPINKGDQFTKKERTTADKLLKAIINNWPALKNTSVEGFRLSFLKRKGKLSKDDNGWNLQVKYLTHDILLESLPWSFGVIKLPWNKQIIYVEWQTQH